MIPETKTVTSMIMTSGHAKWWFGDASTTDASPAMTQSSLTGIWSTQASLPTTTAPPSTDSAQVHALLPLDGLPLPWPWKFDLVDARATLGAVLRGLGTIWRVCQKVYHYPLDPS